MFNKSIEVLQSIFKLILNPLIFITLGWNDILKKYSRSYLGPLWITMTMIIQIIIFAVIFGILLNEDLNTFLPYLSIGIILWYFFSNCIIEATTLYNEASSVMKQIKISPFVFIFRLITRNFLIFSHNIVLVPFIFIFFNINLSFFQLIISFFGLALLLINITLIVSIIALITARFRDLAALITSLLNIFFYATPIMWKIEMVEKSKYYEVLALNPVFILFSNVRDPLLSSYNPANFYYALLSAVTLLLTTLILYATKEKKIPFWI